MRLEIAAVMPIKNNADVRQRYLFAQTACLTLGAALVVWGLAPAVVQRMVTEESPSLSVLSMGTASFMLGFIYIGFCILLGRRVRWCLWAANFLALGLLTTGLCLAMITREAMLPLFMLVLTIATVIATTLALRTPATPAAATSRTAAA